MNRLRPKLSTKVYESRERKVAEYQQNCWTIQATLRHWLDLDAWLDDRCWVVAIENRMRVESSREGFHC